MTYQGNLEVLGEFVRERRKELGLTQTELGARLGWAQERVSVLENGKYGLPALPQLCKLAEALTISTADLLRHAGVLDLQGAAAERAGESVRVRELNHQVIGMIDRMIVIEDHLHDAERQTSQAEKLCASIRERRRHMADLLASSRNTEG